MLLTWVLCDPQNHSEPPAVSAPSLCKDFMSEPYSEVADLRDVIIFRTQGTIPVTYGNVLSQTLGSQAVVRLPPGGTGPRKLTQ